MSAWLRIGEAARVLDLSVDTLRKWDREGRFPARRTRGDHRRYAVAEIMALATARDSGRTSAVATPSHRMGPALRAARQRRTATLSPVASRPQSPPMDPESAAALARLMTELP